MATGFDLGARNSKDLARLGLDKKLISKLSPYLGVKGSKAKALVQKSPLTIDQTDCLTIDTAVKVHFKEQVKVRYDAAPNRGALKFNELPSQAATVLLSVSFQYGLNLKSVAPKFWTQMVEQRWADAIKNLENFGDRHPTRRKREAALLREIVK